MDSQTFEAHQLALKAQVGQLVEYNELTRNKVLSIENFVEKYQPLFTQR